jgi:superfamily II DNA or RNA helicase
MLCLVHRDVLVDQTAEKIHKYNPELSIGIERNKERACEIMDDVIVASVQSIGREGSSRLERFRPEYLGVCFQDEAHHSLAKSYRTIYRHFHIYKQEPDTLNRDALLIGMTATPKRSDNVGLEDIYEKIVYQYPMLDAIEDGWLAHPNAWQVHSDEDLSGVSTRQGDFATGELENAVNTPRRNELIMQKYTELGKTLPAIAFSVDVQHTYDLVDTAKHYGLRVEGVDGKTKTEKRNEIYDRFRNGDLDLLCNCAVLTEGADFPMATVGLMTRPTKSNLAYCQMVGRILRPYPAPEDRDNHSGYVKKSAIIIDFVDNCGRHELITAPTLFGLRADFDVKGKATHQVAKEFANLQKANPELDLRSCVSMEEVQAVVRKINILAPPRISDVVKQNSAYGWLEPSPDIYRLSLPGREALFVELNTLGQAQVFHSSDGIRTQLAVLPSLSEGFAYADQQVPQKATGLLLTNAAWRKKPPSTAQVGLLYKLDKGYKNICPDPDKFYTFCLRRFKSGDTNFSRGGISMMIDSKTASRARRRR